MIYSHYCVVINLHHCVVISVSSSSNCVKYLSFTMDDLDFLETALGLSSPASLTSLEQLEKQLKNCAQPPVLDLDDVIATLDQVFILLIAILYVVI